MTEPMNDKKENVGLSDSNAGLADGVLYSHKYDAYYNAKTGDWLEKVCGDKDCDYCPGRPAKAFVSANVELTGRAKTPEI
ncbi:MAG: hypothetical protein WAW87_03960 [Candidatus Ferrigenium altingense]